MNPQNEGKGISPEIESLIRIEGRTAYSSPHGKDNPETFAYIAGATKWAMEMEGFAEWVFDRDYRFTEWGWYRYETMCFDEPTEYYTTFELSTIYITDKQNGKNKTGDRVS